MWTAMMQAHHLVDQHEEALQLFKIMKEREREGRNGSLSDHTYSLALSIVADMTNLIEGEQIHRELEV